MKAKKGFTLVEILIVVVILGILAAIVIPQFSQASTDAKLNSLCSNLQSIRSQIELYKIQHNDELPDTDAGDGTWTQMTGETDIDGDVAAGNEYGPYLQKIPNNPFNDLNTVAFGAEAAFATGTGWYFCTDSGDFFAADGGSEGMDSGDHGDL